MSAELNTESTSGESPPPVGPPPRVGQTLKLAVRGAWDNLGFVLAMSLTVFLSSAPAISVLAFARSGAPASRVLAACLAALLFLLLTPPAYAGAYWLTHVIYERDEPSYPELWKGAARLYGRAVLLGVIQLGVTAVLVANVLFYLRFRGFGFILLAVVFAYLAFFWLMNCLYHGPILVACEARIIKREDGGRPGMRAVLRNGLLLAASAPLYSSALLLFLMVLGAPLVITGAGLALILPGFAAFLTTQATRDHLVRFHILPPPEDLEEPLPDERWRVQ